MIEKHTQNNRLRIALEKRKTIEETNNIIDRIPLSSNPTPNQKEIWTLKMEKELEQIFNNNEIIQIRKECHCKPSPKEVDKMKKTFQRNHSLLDIEKESSLNIKVVDDNTILITYYQCYCPFIKTFAKKAPKTWCNCASGYCEDFFGQITNRKITCEIIKSITLGNDECLLKIILH